MKNKHLILDLSIIILLSFNISMAQVLSPGDGIRITFYNISDAVLGDFFIQQDNSIQLPYIGLVNTSNRSYKDLKSEIISKYDSLYRGVELIVQPLYKISVLGEVRTPGIYYVTGVEKLLDVLALAGGETADADINNVRINRQNNELKVDIQRIMEKSESDRNIYLQSGDRIYIPRKWWVGFRSGSVIISAAAVVVAILGLFLR